MKTFSDVLKGYPKAQAMAKKAKPKATSAKTGAKWDETQHPRVKDGPGGKPDGQFASKGGSGINAAGHLDGAHLGAPLAPLSATMIGATVKLFDQGPVNVDEHDGDYAARDVSRGYWGRLYEIAYKGKDLPVQHAYSGGFEEPINLVKVTKIGPVKQNDIAPAGDAWRIESVSASGEKSTVSVVIKNGVTFLHDWNQGPGLSGIDMAFGRALAERDAQLLLGKVAEPYLTGAAKELAKLPVNLTGKVLPIHLHKVGFSSEANAWAVKHGGEPIGSFAVDGTALGVDGLPIKGQIAAVKNPAKRQRTPPERSPVIEEYVQRLATDPRKHVFTDAEGRKVARAAGVKYEGRIRERLAKTWLVAMHSFNKEKGKLDDDMETALNEWVGTSSKLTKYWAGRSVVGEAPPEYKRRATVRLATTTTATREFFVWRSMSTGSETNVGYGMEPRTTAFRKGRKILFTGVAATALDRTTAVEWYGQVLTRIRVPKGAKFGTTANAHETEVLLPRFATFRVDSVRRLKGSGRAQKHDTIVSMTYIGLSGDPHDIKPYKRATLPALKKKHRSVSLSEEPVNRFVGDEDWDVLGDDHEPAISFEKALRTRVTKAGPMTWEQVPPLIREVLQATGGRLDASAHWNPEGNERKVAGWASVVALGDGSPVLDLQNNLLSLGTLERAVQKFHEKERRPTGVRHGKHGERVDVGPLTELFVVTPAVKRDLQLDAEAPIGLLAAAHIEDDGTWARVQRGEFKGWSIGGRAIEVEQDPKMFDALVGYAKELIEKEAPMARTFSEVMKAWDESKHPRVKDGPGGAKDGRFTSGKALRSSGTQGLAPQAAALRGRHAAEQAYGKLSGDEMLKARKHHIARRSHYSHDAAGTPGAESRAAYHAAVQRKLEAMGRVKAPDKKATVAKPQGKTAIKASRAALSAAQDGNRIVINGKTVFAGQGNRAGLGSFVYELNREKYGKAAPRIKRKLSELKRGDTVEIHQFRNITRDRGKWVAVARHKV